LADGELSCESYDKKKVKQNIFIQSTKPGFEP